MSHKSDSRGILLKIMFISIVSRIGWKDYILIERKCEYIDDWDVTFQNNFIKVLDKD